MNLSVGTAYYKIYNSVNYTCKVFEFWIEPGPRRATWRYQFAKCMHKRTLKIMAVKPQLRFSCARSRHRHAMQNRGDFDWV